MIMMKIIKILMKNNKTGKFKLGQDKSWLPYNKKARD